MQIAKPTRLIARRRPLLDWAGMERAVADPNGDGPWTEFVARRGEGGGGLLAARRLLLALLWLLPSMGVQALLLVLPGRGHVWFARVFWAGLCRILGVRLRVVGAPAHLTGDGRPVVYVSNHSSWLDIAVLGARLEASFIAKEEVGRWPVIKWIAWLGRTVYVRRARTSTARERDEMRLRLAAGDSLILFPEGTTSDGSRVLPFRSAFLSIAELPVTPEGRTPIVQPVSLVYDRLGGLPAGRATRAVFAWFGDTDLASHVMQLVRQRGMRATLVLHAPIDPAAYPSRKALSEAVWRVAAEGAAALRQNRTPRPLLAPGGNASGAIA